MTATAGARSAPPAGRGSVYRLGAKPKVPGEHGLPKPELQQARFTAAGVEGDYNLYRETQKRSDPDMAVLLLPLETLQGLNREGWPVQPGDLGENVTVTGIPYTALAPRQAVRLGAATVRTIKPCEPCDNLYLLPYVGATRGPEFLKVMLGRRGWFARVETEGIVRKGDPVELVR